MTDEIEKTEAEEQQAPQPEPEPIPELDEMPPAPPHPAVKPRSPHADLTAEQAADAFIKKFHQITIITFAAVIIAAALCIADAFLKFAPAVFPLVVLIGALIFAVAWNKPAKRKNYQDLQEILFCDADPKKMAAVSKILLDKLPQPDDQMAFKLLMGHCYALTGDGERAIRYAKTAEGNDASPGSKLTMYNIRAMVYAAQGATSMLSQMRDEIEALIADEPGLRGHQRPTFAEIDNALAIAARDWPKAYGTLAVLEEPENDPRNTKKNFVAHLLNTERRAKIYAEQGDLRSAKPLMAYLAEHGNTLDAARLARNWINNHPNA